MNVNNKDLGKSTFPKNMPLFIILGIVNLIILSQCISAPPLPSTQFESPEKYIDDLGCFPKDCVLPSGMKELCQQFVTGRVSWPRDCQEMPGQACQKLCEREKGKIESEISGLAEVIDAYEAGWIKPVQFDENFNDSLRLAHGWVAPILYIGFDNKLNINYQLPTINSGFTEAYQRTWEGNGFSNPVLLNLPMALTIFDKNNNLNIIGIENKGETNQSITHTIWDGEKAKTLSIVDKQFVHPASSSVVIDSKGIIHLVFTDTSRGISSVWYTLFSQASWSKPVLISQSLENAIAPAIAVNKNGQLFIAWHQTGGVEKEFSTIYLTYISNGTWVTPIKAPINGDFIQLIVDSQSYAYVINMGIYTIWDGVKWSEPEDIVYPDMGGNFFHWTIDLQDNIHVVWNEYEKREESGKDVVYRQIMYRKREPNGKWGPVMTFGTWGKHGTIEEMHPQIAADQNGVVHVAWGGNIDGKIKQYYTNSSAPVENPSLLSLMTVQPHPLYPARVLSQPEKYTTLPNSNWNMVPINEVTLPSDFQTAPRLAIQTTNRIHLVWQSSIGNDTEIFYSNYDGASWTTPINLSQSTYMDLSPAIAINTDNIYVAWTDITPSSSSVYLSFFDGIKWSKPQKISSIVKWNLPEEASMGVGLSFQVDDAHNPEISSNNQGEVVITFTHETPDSSAIAYTVCKKETCEKERFVASNYPWVFNSGQPMIAIDDENNLYSAFTYSGWLKQGIGSINQPFFTFFDGSQWTEPDLFLGIPEGAETNPYTQLVYNPTIHAIGKKAAYLLFSMRPFEQQYYPYRLLSENSNVYIAFWDGKEWSQAIRVDKGNTFGPTSADFEIDDNGAAHIVWSKYDSYSNTYSIFYTKVDQNPIVPQPTLLWTANHLQEPYPIMNPSIALDEFNKPHIIFEDFKDGEWEVHYLTQK